MREILISNAVGGTPEPISLPDTCSTVAGLRLLIAEQRGLPPFCIQVSATDGQPLQDADELAATAQESDLCHYQFVVSADFSEVDTLEEIEACGVDICRQWLCARHESPHWHRLREERMSEDRRLDEKAYEESFVRLSLCHSLPNLAMAALLETQAGGMETDVSAPKAPEDPREVREMGVFSCAMLLGSVEVAGFLALHYRPHININEVMLEGGNGDADEWGGLWNWHQGYTPLLLALHTCTLEGQAEEGMKLLEIVLGFDDVNVNYKHNVGDCRGLTALKMAEESELHAACEVLRARGAGIRVKKGKPPPLELTISAAQWGHRQRMMYQFFKENGLTPGSHDMKVTNGHNEVIDYMHWKDMHQKDLAPAEFPLTLRLEKRKCDGDSDSSE